MFKGLCLMGTVNFLFYSGCIIWLTNTPTSGPEGIGIGFLAMLCLAFSVLLTGFGLNQVYREVFNGTIKAKVLVATLISASPLILCMLYAVFHHKARS